MVARDICRRRARAECIGDVLVLGDLRCLELEALILIAEALCLLVREVIDDAVADLVDGLHRGAVVLLVLETSLHCLLLVLTAARCDLLLDGGLRVTAALRELCLDGLRVTAVRFVSTSYGERSSIRSTTSNSSEMRLSMISSWLGCLGWASDASGTKRIVKMLPSGVQRLL